MDNIEKIREQSRKAINEVIELAELREGDVLVVGCSTSEIVGGSIGKDSSKEVGIALMDEILGICESRGIYPAIQGCEHINRALTVPRILAKEKNLEIVTVVPALNAGGALSVAAYDNIVDPVVVERIVADAGMDIGDTEVGMHVKFVQVPLRLTNNIIGGARVTALKSRPKLIGGARAQYE